MKIRSDCCASVYLSLIHIWIGWRGLALAAGEEQRQQEADDEQQAGYGEGQDAAQGITAFHPRPPP